MEKKCAYCDKVLGDYLRTTKKYCNDSCKQMAYYARQNETMGITSTSFTEEEDASSSFAVSSEAMENEADSISSSSFELDVGDKDEEKNVVAPISDTIKRPKYEYHSSAFIDALTNAIQVQFNPSDYFDYCLKNPRLEVSKHCFWVSVRLRCLIENIIRLSRYRTVPVSIFKQLAQATNQLCSSNTFLLVCNSYPYADLLIHLRTSLDELAKTQLTVSMRYPLEFGKKIELMAARHYIGDIAPRLLFSQLVFSDIVEPPKEKKKKKKDKDQAEESD